MLFDPHHSTAHSLIAPPPSPQTSSISTTVYVCTVPLAAPSKDVGLVMLFSSQTGDLTLHAYHTSMTELIQGEEIHLRCFRVSMTIAQWPCMSVYKLVEICNSCVCPIMSHIVTVLMHTAHGGSTGTVWVCALCCVSSKRAVYSPILLWLSTVWFSGIEQWGLCVASWTAYAFRYDRTLLGTYCVCVYVQMDVSKTTNGLWTPQ